MVILKIRDIDRLWCNHFTLSLSNNVKIDCLVDMQLNKQCYFLMPYGTLLQLPKPESVSLVRIGLFFFDASFYLQQPIHKFEIHLSNMFNFDHLNSKSLVQSFENEITKTDESNA